MWLDEFCAPFTGRACRHIPVGSPYDPLDPQFATTARGNRWNLQGEPTLYLASSHEVLAVEWARHFPSEAPVAVGHRARLRRIFDMAVALDVVLDLRDRRLCSVLALRNAPYCFADKELCRSTSHELRLRSRAQALLVPTLGMLDRDDVWGLVLFVDKLPSFPDRFVTSVTANGTFGLLGQ